MNTIKIEGNWDQQKDKLKKRFAILTDNDLLFDQGKKKEMFGKVQEKLGKTKAEFAAIIAAL